MWIRDWNRRLGEELREEMCGGPPRSVVLLAPQTSFASEIVCTLQLYFTYKSPTCADHSLFLPSWSLHSEFVYVCLIEGLHRI